MRERSISRLSDRDEARVAIALARAARASGIAPGTPGYNPAWYALTDVYWDPTNGSDANTGLNGSPVKTWAEIVRRYGSPSPIFNYGQSVEFHDLSAQPAAQDPVFFEPFVSGGGQAILNAIAGWTVLQPAFAAGAVTAKARGAPGTRLQVASMPAGTAAGQLVFNQTRNSYAFIDSMVGSTATVEQPQTAASLTSTAAVPAGVEDDTWATGDTLIVYQVPALNLKRWAAKAIDVTAGGQPSGGWVIGAQIVDPSGAGTSAYAHHSSSPVNVLSLCNIGPRVDFSSENGRGFAAYLLGCHCTASVLFLGFGGIYGGSFQGMNIYAQELNILNDAYAHGAVLIEGAVVCANVFSDGTWTVYAGGQIDVHATAFWGSYNVNLNPGGLFWNNTSGGTFAANALLTSGALHIGAATTGSSYSAGAWTDGVNLTPANLDTNNGLQNPRTGARFTNGT